MNNSKRWNPAYLVTGAALLVVLLWSAPAALDDTNCSGSIGAITVDNLIVLENETCTLNGTRVEGNIFVRRGATLHAYAVRVDGNIQANDSARVNVYSGSFVDGSIQIKDSGAANIQSVNIDGDLQFETNTQFLSADGNTIGGNLQAFENTGGVSVTDNTIDGNLQCKDNQPPPTGGGNTVYGSAEDQCAYLEQGSVVTATPTATQTHTNATPTATQTRTNATPVPPTTTPIPPTKTFTPTATSPGPTPTGLAAADDAYTLAERQISVPAPGILANDTFSDPGAVEIVVVSPVQHGSLSLGQSGDFFYRAETGFFGEDSFTYQLRSEGVLSNEARVRLVMVDEQQPVVIWISPVQEMGETFNIFEGQQVILEVQVSDNNAIALVSFMRWDALSETYAAIAALNQPPFRVEVSASSLNGEWNQIVASVQDQAGNNSGYSYIWLYKYQQTRTFLPLVAK